MRCRKCKRDIPENSIYCNWCGARQLRERRREVKVPTPKQLPSGSWTIYLRAEGQSVTEPTSELCAARARAIRAGFIEAQKASSGMTLGQAYDAYMDSRKGVLSPTTYRGYLTLRRTSFQTLMDADVQRITVDQVQRDISKMSMRGVSPKTVSNAVGLLSAVLRTYAPDIRLDIRLPQKQKKEPRKIDGEEIGAIMAAVRGKEIELPVLMGLWLGMRVGEVRGARFEDIRNGRLHICREIVDDANGKPVVKPPKTFSGDRWVSLPPQILALIEAQGRSEGYIVGLSGQAIYKRFMRTLKAAGIEHCRFHDLRHANAAVMLRLGVDSRYAQERNGWASDRMYKQVYGYTMDDRMKDIAASIDNYFADKFTDEEKKP